MKKEIILFNNETISIEYVNEHFNAGDTSVELYSKYKISLILSNGINAVTKNKVIACSKNSILFFRPDELHFGRFEKDETYSYLDIFITIPFTAFKAQNSMKPLCINAKFYIIFLSRNRYTTNHAEVSAPFL